MTLEQLRTEADSLSYKLVKKLPYSCSCYHSYPNENHKHGNGKWKCVDKYEPVEYDPKYNKRYAPKTHCRKKEDSENG